MTSLSLSLSLARALSPSLSQVTWGVRFSDDAQVLRFVEQLSGEVAARLQAAKVKTRAVQVTLLRAVRALIEP